LLLAAALLAGCAPLEPVRIADATLLRVRTPGVTCAPGLRLDAEAGCTRDRAEGAVLLRLRQRSEMGPAFRLMSAFYGVDGRGVRVWNRAPDGVEPPEGLVASLPVAPGEHVLVTRLLYQGQGEGPFAYLSGYKFEVRSTHQLTVEAGGATDVTMTGYEKGGVTTPMEVRPAVRWSEAEAR
jgi:hypothetical protein